MPTQLVSNYFQLFLTANLRSGCVGCSALNAALQCLCNDRASTSVGWATRGEAMEPSVDLAVQNPLGLERLWHTEARLLFLDEHSCMRINACKPEMIMLGQKRTTESSMADETTKQSLASRDFKMWIRQSGQCSTCVCTDNWVTSREGSLILMLKTCMTFEVKTDLVGQIWWMRWCQSKFNSLLNLCWPTRQLVYLLMSCCSSEILHYSSLERLYYSLVSYCTLIHVPAAKACDSLSWPETPWADQN